MIDERDEWVRVESEDELRPGMAVQLRPCMFCGNAETFFLTRQVPAFPAVREDGSWSPDIGKQFLLVGGRCHPGPSQFTRAIRERRLYRLRDLPAEETTTVATKRRVSVKAGR